MSRRHDPRNTPAWRTLLAGILLTLGASLLGTRSAEGSIPGVVTAVTWAAAWFAGARFRWFTVRRGKAWLVMLVLAWLGVLGGTAGMALGLVPGVLFMMRRQVSFRLLAGKRRVAAFLLGVPVLAATFVAGTTVPDGLVGDVTIFARVGVQVFWLSELMTMLFGMRLHFMRLRPKLAVTGILVGGIPLVLLAVFGLLLLYGSLGGSRANRALDIMGVWAETFGDGRVPDVFPTESLTWSEADPGEGIDWAADFVAAVRARRRELDLGMAAPPEDRRLVLHEEGAGQVRLDLGDDEPWLPDVVAAQDTVVWIRHGRDIWLVHLRDPEAGAAHVEALPLDADVMTGMARRLRADVSVTRGRFGDDGGADDVADRAGLTGRFNATEADSSAGWWRRTRHFGAALVPAPHLDGRYVEEGYIVLHVETAFGDLAHEFFSTENMMNVGLMIALGVAALLLMVTGTVALIFSARITGGITGAVKALHRGTRRIASGDLETVIDIENEDEFGDLADSFNAMTVAVKQGREDALARERLQQEMETARGIQERLLPHDEPLLPGWDVTGVSIPSLQVGGDYFDFLQPGAGRLGVAIGDVSGKGMPAALLMSNLQACLKGQVLHPASVSDVVTRVNDLLAESTDPHMFATFFYGEIDSRTGHVTSTNAGHNPPLLVRRDGTVEWLETGGLLLGMLAGQPYEQVAVELDPGDVLVLYTDGITEAGAPEIPMSDEEADGNFPDDVDDDEVMFGEARLAEVVVRARGRSALGIREAILAAVHDFVTDGVQGDDITLVVVRRREDFLP